MLPAPSTIAISTPRSCPRLISSATSRSRVRSVPYSRSPMSDSPDSLSRIRRKMGAGPSVTRRGRSLADREPREAPDHDVLAGLGRQVGAHLLDRARLVLVLVDVLLVEQHD